LKTTYKLIQKAFYCSQQNYKIDEVI